MWFGTCWPTGSIKSNQTKPRLEVSGLAAGLALPPSPGTSGLCEVALGVGSSSILGGEGLQKPGTGTQVGDGSHHAGGSVPQGRAEPLPPLPHPGSCTPPPPATEVTPGGREGGGGPRVRGPQGLGPGRWGALLCCLPLPSPQRGAGWHHDPGCRGSPVPHPEPSQGGGSGLQSQG